MSVERKKRVRVFRDGNHVRRERVSETSVSTRQVLVSRVSKFLWLLTAVVVGLISFRFVLKLIGANEANGFVDFVYDLTYPLVSLFEGIVTSPTVGVGLIDMASLFAAFVYVLVALAIVTLFRILFSTAGQTRNVSTVEYVD